MSNGTVNLDMNSVIAQGISFGTVVGAIIGWIPGIAALFGAVFYALSIYEGKTVQLWLHTRRLLKLARLRKSLANMEAIEKAHKHL